MGDEAEPTREDLEKTQECALFFTNLIERISDIGKAVANGTRDPVSAREQVKLIAKQMDQRYQEALPFIERARPVFREAARRSGQPATRLSSFPDRGFLSSCEAVFAHGLKLIGISRRGELPPPPVPPPSP